MTEKRNQTSECDRRTPLPEAHEAPNRIDRRGFVRGAAMLTVGGGQSGLAIAYGLRRKGVGHVEVIDRTEPGQAGIWRTTARITYAIFTASISRRA